MKRLTNVIFFLVCIAIYLTAQAPPQAFSFKASIKGEDGKLLINQTVNMRVSILQDNTTGPEVFAEVFTPTTNNLGQVDLEIGRGETEFGAFSLIDWSAHEYFLKIEVDLLKKCTYKLVSITQLLSVPYALYAGATANAFSGNYNDLFNTPEIPTRLSQLSNDAGFLTHEVDGSVTNELQDIRLSGTNLSISNGSTVNLAGIDTRLTEAEVDAFVSDNGYLTSFTEVDGSVTNELQTLSLRHDTLFLSNGGFVKLPVAVTAGGQFYYYDNDGDGYGIADRPVWVPSGVAPPAGFVAGETDCNDENAALHPGAQEIANDGIDQDCDGADWVFDPNENWQPGDPWVDIRDNYAYNTVLIGSQVWMAENLRAVKYTDGTPIPMVTDNQIWANLHTGACCTYENRPPDPYGMLYNWHAVSTEKLCPSGWHVPSETEWMQLLNLYGGLNTAGYAIKEAGTAHWAAPNPGSTNSSGFTALPGGGRTDGGRFWNIRTLAEFWSTTISSNTAANLHIINDRPYIQIHNNPLYHGHSVRCLKD